MPLFWNYLAKFPYFWNLIFTKSSLQVKLDISNVEFYVYFVTKIFFENLNETQHY